MENFIALNSNWDEVKEKIKESNSEISEADLDFAPGKENELFERLSDKLQMNCAEIKSWVKSISTNKTIAG